MNHRTTTVTWLCLVAGALVACGEETAATGGTDESSAAAAASAASSPGTPPRAPRPSTGEPVVKGTIIVAKGSAFGTILFDRAGQAIYLFDVETTPRPRCYGPCAEAWPPVLTDAPPRAGRGVRPGLLDTTRRRDGARQVTYRGHPLYFYAHEGKNEVECHDVFLNGGTWYALQPDGSRAP